MKILIRNQQRRIRVSRTKIERIARKVLSILGHHTTELGILLVNNERMRKLNSTFRGIDKSTDVLSFESRIPGVPSNLPGDVVICIPRAAMQARQFGVDFYDEISRLLIHGILHLLGYEHERNKYQARKMRRMEKELLIAIQNAKCKNQNYGIP